MKYRTILVDLSNIARRAFHTSKGLTTSIDGVEVPIGMVFGTIRSIVKLHEELATRDGRTIICDEYGSQARKAMFPGYKAARAPHEAEFDSQHDLLRDLIDSLCWPRTWSDDWEADDVIATLAEVAEGPIAIVTADLDLHQCVRDSVHVIDPNANHRDLTDGRSWRLRDVRRFWGFEPNQIPDALALSGDGDEYPGVTGIGEKKARALIEKFGDLKSVKEAARASLEIGIPKLSVPTGDKFFKVDVVELLSTPLDLYQDLATVRTDVDITFADREGSPDPLTEFRRLRFASLTAPSTLKICAEMAVPA